MRQTIALSLPVCTVLIVAAIVLSSAHAVDRRAPRTLTLKDAVRIALAGNSRLVAARLSLEGEQEGLEAARADFDLKLVPTLRLGKISLNAAAEHCDRTMAAFSKCFG